MANWSKLGTRGNVIDRRGFAPVAAGLSLTTVAVVVLVNYLLGGDLTDVVSQLDTLPVEQQYVETGEFEGEDKYEVFASTVLGSTDQYWETEFSKQNQTYIPPQLVLFREATESRCGIATSQLGPHYCPLDSTIYLDETFFDELTARFGAQGGDVAEAYVIAHEAAHHIQNLLGTMDQVFSAQQNNSPDAQQLAINLELQADCYSGLWANSIRELDVLGPNEIQEAMDAAAAVGDDRIQKNTQGYVSPETWTHGSSDQRVSWFNKGYESGELAACDTFNE